jgi:hypothetical protein
LRRTPSVKRIIGQYVSDGEESYALCVQYDDARPVEMYDAENVAATLDMLRSLRLPGFAPDSDCWQTADVNVDQRTHGAKQARRNRS